MQRSSSHSRNHLKSTFNTESWTYSKPTITYQSEYATRLLRLGWHCIQARDFKSAEEEFATAVSTCEEEEDPKALLKLHKSIAKMWMHVYSVPRALVHLKKMKGFADQTQQSIEKMKEYRDLGTCYQLVRKYETALVYFKKLLELAWYVDNIEMELSAYDNIGKQYYYLGLMDKAMYYNNRAWRGIVELKNSPARVLARNAFEARRKPKLHLSSDNTSLRPKSGNSSDLSNSELPSPINNSSTTNALSQLPYQSEQQQVSLPPLRRHGRTKLNQTQPINLEPEVSSYVLMSHLSLNRSLKNYQCLKDSRKVKVRETKKKAAV